MKKSVILGFSLACLMLSGQAQTSLKNELQLSYGLVSVPFMIEQTGNVLFTIFTLGLYDRPDKISSTGVINFGYYYALSNRVSIGTDYGWEKLTLEWTDNQPEENESFTVNVNSIMGGLKYRYLIRPDYGLYGKVNLGVNMHSRSKETQYDLQFSNLAYQISPIGVYFGDKFQGFCELGLGYRGLLNFGINLKF